MGRGITAARTDKPITELRARVDRDGGVQALSVHRGGGYTFLWLLTASASLQAGGRRRGATGRRACPGSTNVAVDRPYGKQSRSAISP